jgi:hypothetical protein
MKKVKIELFPFVQPVPFVAFGEPMFQSLDVQVSPV